LLDQVLPLVTHDDLWIADRNFCTVDFLETIASLPGFGMAPEGHFLYSSGPNM
jgi:hypothetical protein